jgi:replicative DNA helicase
MMTDPGTIDDVMRLVAPGAFYEARNRMIFSAIVGAHEAGDPVSPEAINVRLTASGDIVKAGGIGYLLEVVQQVPVAAQAVWHASKLRTFAVARGLQEAGSRAQTYAYSLALEDPAEAVERIRNDLDALDAGTHSDDELVPWSEVATHGLLGVEAAEKAEGELAPVSTGLLDLDLELSGGLRPGQLVVVAGRTSMGKSVLARNFARAAAFGQKLTTALFSLEMSEQEIFNAVVAAELGINITAMNEGKLSDEEWTRVARFIGNTADVPLYVSDNGSISLAGIRLACRQLKRRQGLGLVVVDYMQLVDLPSGRETRQVGVGELARGLKKLAAELRCPVVALSQLNRGPEHRVDKRPSMADLRESGDIENSANIIVLIHREDYYDKDSSRRGEADLIIAKNRGGRQVTVVAASQLHLGRFASMALGG